MRALTPKELEWIAVFALEPQEPSGGKSAWGNGLLWGIGLSAVMWVFVFSQLLKALEG